MPEEGRGMNWGEKQKRSSSYGPVAWGQEFALYSKSAGNQEAWWMVSVSKGEKRSKLPTLEIVLGSIWRPDWSGDQWGKQGDQWRPRSRQERVVAWTSVTAVENMGRIRVAFSWDWILILLISSLCLFLKMVILKFPVFLDKHLYIALPSYWSTVNTTPLIPCSRNACQTLILRHTPNRAVFSGIAFLLKSAHCKMLSPLPSVISPLVRF